MKKRDLIIVAFLLVAAVAFSSCKTHERCPAYGFNSTAHPSVTTQLAS